MPNESTRARVTEASGRECPLTFQCAAGEGGVHACLQLSCFSFGAISHARAHTRTSTCTCTRTQNALAVLTAVNFVGLLCTYPIPEPRFAPARTQIHTHTHTHTHTHRNTTRTHTHTHTHTGSFLTRSLSLSFRFLEASSPIQRLLEAVETETLRPSRPHRNVPVYTLTLRCVFLVLALRGKTLEDLTDELSGESCD